MICCLGCANDGVAEMVVVAAEKFQKISKIFNFFSIFFLLLFDNFSVLLCRWWHGSGAASVAEKFQKISKISNFFFQIFQYRVGFCITAPLILHNLLADRPAPRGAAGGAGGGPPCKSKNTTFKIFKKKATTTW